MNEAQQINNPDRRLWDRAFQICREKGWDSNNMLNWCSAIAIARKETVQ